MGPFRGPYRGSPLRDPCWWAVTTEVAAHWEEVLMGPFRGGTHRSQIQQELQLRVAKLVVVGGVLRYLTAWLTQVLGGNTKRKKRKQRIYHNSENLMLKPNRAHPQNFPSVSFVFSSIKQRKGD